MGGLEGFPLQEAFGFAPGSGGFAARTRCKKETSRGPAAPAPPPGEFASSILRPFCWSRVLVRGPEPARATCSCHELRGGGVWGGRVPSGRLPKIFFFVANVGGSAAVVSHKKAAWKPGTLWVPLHASPQSTTA